MLTNRFIPRHRLRVWVGCVAVSLAVSANGEHLGVDLRPKPDPVGLSAFDICVIRGDAEINLEPLHANNTQCLALVNVRDVEIQSAAATEAQRAGLPLRESPKAGFARMDLADPNWLTVAVREVIRPAMERGFGGVVLAGLEGLDEEAERVAAMDGIAALHAMFPDKTLVLKDAQGLLAGSARHLQGVFITGSPGSGEEQMREAVRLGLKAYVVEWATEKTVAWTDRAQKLEALGAIPFFTTPALDGSNFGPLREITKRILVLHSGDPKETFAAKVLHGSLQWLGYYPQYRTFNESLLSSESFDGVVIDQTLAVDEAQQNPLAEAILRLAEQKVPILFTGLPVSNGKAFDKIKQTLGWEGSGQCIQPVRKSAFARLEGRALQSGGAVTPRTQDFRDLRAPAKAKVLTAIRSASGITFDSVYLAAWGGLWLDSVAPAAGPQISPLYFLEQWLGERPETPVMDVASLNGNRLMVTQVQSEGFAATSSVPGLPLAAEALLERVLKKYALPCTVAFCEGDLRGWTPATDPRDHLRYAEAARAILAEPRIEAASASLSRPNQWDDKEFKPGPLTNGAEAGELSMQREIGGSLAYIHRQLLPPDKVVAAMLWPGTSRPGREALSFARRMGVACLSITASPFMAGGDDPIAPVAWMASETPEILACSSRPEGLLDASAMIREFQRTETGAWQGAAHVVLSFNDARSERSLREVETLLDWCQAQPWQKITASEYSRIVTDALDAHVYRVEPSHWIIVNQGRARTLRLPASAGVPDMKLSNGVAGYTVRGDQIYIHTLGRRRTELVMQPDSTPGHLRLTAASGRLDFMEASGTRNVFCVREAEPVRVTYGGLRPGAACLVRSNGKLQEFVADAGGAFEFTAPPRALVQLQQITKDHATFR
jgi:hypothetical protein